jgi:signal peptidase I
MDPTFKNGDYLIVDEVSYHLHNPHRGDVIVFKAPPQPTEYYIKRIIGLPGDTVHLNNGQVTITNAANPKGFTLDQSFITHDATSNGTYVVPPDEYFVMGDNRSGSFDSRSWGFLPAKNIRGRALLRLLPLNSIALVPGKENYDQSN